MQQNPVIGACRSIYKKDKPNPIFGYSRRVKSLKVFKNHKNQKLPQKYRSRQKL
jgi:hypothetical protein